MKRTWIGQRVLILAFLSSCQDNRLPSGPDQTWSEGPGSAIEYTVSGGFVGGIHTKLVVTPAGEVTLSSVSPPLEGALTPSERSSLATFSNEIWIQPDTLRGGCVDDFTYLVRWTDRRGTKTITAEGCALMPPGRTPVPAIAGLVQILDSIAKRVFEEDAPWRGMQVDFRLDDSSYSLDAPIKLTFAVTNPTSRSRALYFSHTEQFWFTVDKDNFPGFHFSYPASLNGSSLDILSPSSIQLNPGERKDLVYVWMQTVINPKGVSERLSVGSYHLQMGLLAGDFGTRSVNFDVYNGQVPIKGDITPDFPGGDASSHQYVFQLRVTNRTASDLTLHFNGNQRIAVELWDLDFDPPTTIIYETQGVPPSGPESRILAPLETLVFADTVRKSAMMPGYFWTLAKIRLLCTDFDFEREGQLQIFR